MARFLSKPPSQAGNRSTPGALDAVNTRSVSGTTTEITMADSDWLDAPSTMFNDPCSTDHFSAEAAFATNPAYEWCATAGPDDSADDTRAISQGYTTADLLAAQGTGVSPKGASRGRADAVDRAVLDSMLHLPRAKAAQMLGLCTTTFKKVCRRAGLQGWPYRRPLMGANQEEAGASMSLSRGSSDPSPIQLTPALLARAPSSSSSSMRRLSDFPASRGTFPRAASQPMMAPRSASFSSTASSSNFSNASSSSSLDAAAAQRSAPFGLTTSAVTAVARHTRKMETSPVAECPEQSCHVVDAVMDYLDTLWSGGATVDRGELEELVDGPGRSGLIERLTCVVGWE
ncbi:hypothetical protein T484DRAFT_1856484 [Baffinella frigidus]|nr:hypothetical protein T484DRAFT_1856484 [Cryptophyta sp. CCMP2293]